MQALSKIASALGFAAVIAFWPAVIVTCVLYPALPLYLIASFEWVLPILGLLALAASAIVWFFDRR